MIVTRPHHPTRNPMTRIYPVIHYRDQSQALMQAQLAHEAGADGVMLISHYHAVPNEALFAAAGAIRAWFPRLSIGINLLSIRMPDAAYREVLRLGAAAVDSLWVDYADFTSSWCGSSALDLSGLVHSTNPGRPRDVFAGVAFKHQQHEPNPLQAAQRARTLGFIPTTSGPATGVPPDVEKVRSMSAAAGGVLAVASGLTPHNVAAFAPYLSHILVATGVSRDEYNFDYELLRTFVGAVRQARAAMR